MASRDELHLSVTDEEIDGVLSAGAMLSCAKLPPVAEWLARRGGITEAAKRIAAVVDELQPCRPADVWARIGNALGEQEWGRFLDEAIATRIVCRTSDGRLVALRRVA